jgi:GTP-binding protein LepA
MEIAFGAHPEDVYVVDEVGYLQLGQRRAEVLEAGEVGYVIANLRSVSDTRAGDTILDASERASELLPGYREVKSMVFAGIYPTDSEQYEGLGRVGKLQTRVCVQPESSTALGFDLPAFGLLHMEIVENGWSGNRPRPDHHRADGGVPRLHGGWDDVPAGSSANCSIHPPST